MAWRETKDELSLHQTPTLRHDIAAPIFNGKLKIMKVLLTKYKISGEVKAHMYTIEWQKSGLLHAHILIWLGITISTDCLDSMVSAEIPDPNADPLLYQIVKNHMIHGPCAMNTKADVDSIIQSLSQMFQ